MLNFPDFKDEARKIAAEIIENRRFLHRNPELGFQEYWTTAFIKEKLRSYGIELIDFAGATGVIGLLDSSVPGPCVALRADIDALPIDENSGCSFPSERPGVMHACGHDSHMAVLLGAAKMLAARKDELRGKVKFIFQPAEEVTDGAQFMIRAGALENPPVDFIFGLHCTPEAEAGTLLVSRGPATAFVAMTALTVTGQGGHGALPHLAKDPLVASAAMLMALQSVVSREVPPDEAAVVTFGSIHGGNVPNIIPDKVELTGTVRATKNDIFQAVGTDMERIIRHTAQAMRVKAEFCFKQDVPGCFNPPYLVDVLTNNTIWRNATAGRGGASSLSDSGQTNVQSIAERTCNSAVAPLVKVYGADKLLPAKVAMVGEDFACYQQLVPGVFCWYGVGNKEKGISASLHNACFSIDESALALAAAAHAQVAYDLLVGGVLPFAQVVAPGAEQSSLPGNVKQNTQRATQIAGPESGQENEQWHEQWHKQGNKLQ